MKHTLVGYYDSDRQVMLDGKYLSPKKSQKVYNHSPDGFNWGYGGSGPAQLALAICMELMPREEALAKYQDLKRSVIAGLPQGKDFEIEFKL